MKNIDLLELAMRRLNIEYGTVFEVYNKNWCQWGEKEKFKITKEKKDKLILWFSSTDTYGMFFKDTENALMAILFGDLNIKILK